MSECIFCKIVSGQVPSTIVHRDEEIVAFRDLSAQAPVHLLVVPVRHIPSLSDASEGDRALLGSILLRIRDLAAREGIDRGGYRVGTNRGTSAGQSVFHLHFHVLGGRPMAWPPG